MAIKPQRSRQSGEDVDLEFLPEIPLTYRPEFELKNELADEPLLIRGRQGPAKGKHARSQTRHVGLEIVLVLIMRAADMRERRHAQPDYIGPLPEAIAINEIASRSGSLTAV